MTDRTATSGEQDPPSISSDELSESVDLDQLKSWSEPAKLLVTELGLGPRVSYLGANESFILENPEQVWMVVEGNVDIFLLLDVNGRAVQGKQGMRHHLLRVSAGGVIFSISGMESGFSFLAVPTNGTGLVDMHLADLMNLRERRKNELAQAVDDWLKAILNEIRMKSPPSEALSADGLIDANRPIKAGEVVCGYNRPFWFNPVPANTVFSGITLIEQENPAGYFPLVDNAWLRMKNDVELEAISTSDWLDQASAADDLIAYNRFIAKTFLDQELRRKDTLDIQTGSREQNSERNFRKATLALYNVLAHSGGKEPPPLSSHPFVAAAQMVAFHMEMDFQISEEIVAVVQQDVDPAYALARQAGFSVRPVELGDDWWTMDHGPLLAFLGENKRPCALLPVTSKQYELVDPESGSREILTSETARHLNARAYSFFRPLPESSDWNGWKLARFGIKGGRKDANMVITMVLLMGILSLVIPVFTGWIVDPVIPSAELGQLTVLVIGIILAGLSSVVFSLVQTIAMVRLEGRMVYSVQPAVWDRLLKLPASFFEKFTVGDLANRADGIDTMRSLVSSSVVDVLLHSAVGIFSLGLMAYFHLPLAMVTAGLVIVYCLFTYFIGKKVLLQNREVVRLTGFIQGMVFQFLSAISKLRVAGAEQDAYAKWAMKYAEMQSYTYEQRSIANAMEVSKTFFHYLTIIALLTMIGWESKELLAFYRTPETWAAITSESIQKYIPTGKFVAFYVAFGQFMVAVFGITHIFVELVNLKPLMERVQPILEEKPENDAGAAPPGEILGALEFQDVCFRYTDHEPFVLNGITFQAKPGQFIAIVGPSGAGKSTIVRLLLGFENPESGSVFVDGMPLSELDKRMIRRSYGVVLQSGKILAGTLFNNISAGANITMDQAWEAARMAGLDKDIKAMPMGMDTYLGEGAATLSGGQRQRLMIARAVARKPRILIFDEATSALDNETQNLVSQRIEEMQSTRIVIAHRLSTIVNADKIYVIDKGRVVEEGNYLSLLSQNGLFKQLTHRQLV